MNLPKHHHKVLIVTGGFLSGKEGSFVEVVKRQINQWQFSKFSWLEAMVKLTSVEPIVYVQSALRNNKIEAVSQYFKSTDLNSTPELTETLLATLLKNEGMDFEVASINELFSHKNERIRLLHECDTVFISTTLLRDLSEMFPILNLLKTPHNHLVVGGPLTQLLKENIKFMTQVEVVAVGHGEFLVPALCEWIKSDFKNLLPHPHSIGSKLEKVGDINLLYSGHPETSNLDIFPAANWALAEKYHNKKFPVIHYESVRGCPYRCSFCNYPFLFNENSFRYRSALQIANDWENYEKTMGPKIINCLDSLFTMPRKRLFELCKYIVERNLKSQWVCYARSEDLADEEVCKAMKSANILQVQIGLESGSPQILENMSKHCTLEENIKAIENCRKYGITSVVSLIVGFPGETDETIEMTYELIKKTKPDFFFVATFSTRAAGVPILSLENRKKFGIWIDENIFSVSPYWDHATMSASQVGIRVRNLQLRIMKEKLSLNAFAFYSGIFAYKLEDRDALLDFQSEAVRKFKKIPKIFYWAIKFIEKRIERDIQKLKNKKNDKSLALEQVA